eukprot:GEMP01026115.1.p1 GENE.GEMP01026115.1~~GEMP01026115.1.p1  ORF type:complete len:787 (+),score=177.64 GEMP01026115.1:203-2362(+)
MSEAKRQRCANTNGVLDGKPDKDCTISSVKKTANSDIGTNSESSDDDMQSNKPCDNALAVETNAAIPDVESARETDAVMADVEGKKVGEGEGQEASEGEGEKEAEVEREKATLGEKLSETKGNKETELDGGTAAEGEEKTEGEGEKAAEGEKETEAKREIEMKTAMTADQDDEDDSDSESSSSSSSSRSSSSSSSSSAQKKTEDSDDDDAPLVPAPSASLAPQITDADDDAPLVPELALEPYKEAAAEVPAVAEGDSDKYAVESAQKPEEEKDDWKDWKDKGWGDWQDESDVLSEDEKRIYANVLVAQATRDDLLRILQFPSQQVVEEERLACRSREEAVLDLFVRVHVNWNGTDQCLLCRAEGFDKSETYTVTPGGSWGKPRPVNYSLRVRRGSHTKVFSLDVLSNSPIKEEEFHCWYDWVTEEDLLPSAASIDTTKHRLHEARRFTFDTHIIDTLLARGKRTQVSQLYRQTKSSVESLRFQLQSGGIHSRDIPATTAQLRRAEREYEDATEKYMQKKDTFERENARMYGISSVNNRNILKQQRLDRAVALAAENDLTRDKSTMKLNPFSRRECQPVVMWDIGKGAESANISEPQLKKKEDDLNAQLEKHAAGGADRDMVFPTNRRDVNLETIAPAPLHLDDGANTSRRPRQTAPMLTFGTQEDAPLRKILSTIHEQGSSAQSKNAIRVSGNTSTSIVTPSRANVVSFREWKQRRQAD